MSVKFSYVINGVVMVVYNKVAKFLNRLFLDPLGIQEEVYKMSARTSKFQGDLFHTTKRLEELVKAFSECDERISNNMFLEQVDRALHYSVPDMFWVKDLEGRYIKANDAIRKKLLFCEDPIGRDDRSIAKDIVDRIGEDNHTFGAICGNSDLEVLRQELPIKFNEDGIVNGKYIILQVHKNVVRDVKGTIIGVVGIGRDITYEVRMLEKGITLTNCVKAKKVFKEIIDHYRFEDRS